MSSVIYVTSLQMISPPPGKRENINFPIIIVTKLFIVTLEELFRTICALQLSFIKSGLPFCY